MRGEEIRRGIDVYPSLGPKENPAGGEEGKEMESLGKSRRAATMAVSETALSRVLNATPIMVIPPLILVRLQQRRWFKRNPRLTLPVNLGMGFPGGMLARLFTEQAQQVSFLLRPSSPFPWRLGRFPKDKPSTLLGWKGISGTKEGRMVRLNSTVESRQMLPLGDVTTFHIYPDERTMKHRIFSNGGDDVLGRRGVTTAAPPSSDHQVAQADYIRSTP